MKTFIFSIFLLLLFGCGRRSDSSESVPIRMDKTAPNFNDTTAYYLNLYQMPDTKEWHLALQGYTNYLSSSLTENGDTVVTITHGDLAIDQEKDFQIIKYDKSIIDINTTVIEPKLSGTTSLIYKTPAGIDSTIILVDDSLKPKLINQ